MTPDELEDMLRLLRAYWPSIDWTEDHQAVWIIEFEPLTFPAARDAVIAMARQETWPSIATFLSHLHPRHDGVIADGNRRFSPGIGWLGEATSEQPALESGEPPAVIDFDTARRLIEEARRKRERDNPGA